MKTIAVVNQKGGVGKSATAVCLSAALAEKGRKVLLIDLDPQCSASSWLGVEGDGQTLLDLLIQDGNLDEITKQAACGIDVVPCGTGFAAFDRYAATSDPGSEFMLREAVERLGKAASRDYIFLDCPPNLNIPSISALIAADLMIVPTDPKVATIEPLSRLFRTSESVRKRYNASLSLAGIVVCMADFRKNHTHDMIGALQRKFGDQVYKTAIRDNVKIAESFGHKQPITHYDPRSNGAQDYRKLAEEFETRMTDAQPRKAAHG